MVNKLVNNFFYRPYVVISKKSLKQYSSKIRLFNFGGNARQRIECGAPVFKSLPQCRCRAPNKLAKDGIQSSVSTSIPLLKILRTPQATRKLNSKCCGVSVLIGTLLLLLIPRDVEY